MRYFFLVILLFQVSSHLVAGDERTAQLEAQARQLSAQLGGQLKARLQAAIEAGGPANAITVCNVSAPGIAAELSADGWTVGRTSLKLRNPANRPDTWEHATLLDFEQRLADGEPIADLQSSTVETGNGETRYRFMKAIAIDTACMACHGEAVAEPVQAALAEKYPHDAAKGYRPGDLRGAFTITKILTNEADE